MVEDPTVPLWDVLLAVRGPLQGAHKKTKASKVTMAIMPANVLPLIRPLRSRPVRRPKSLFRITASLDDLPKIELPRHNKCSLLLRYPRMRWAVDLMVSCTLISKIHKFLDAKWRGQNGTRARIKEQSLNAFVITILVVARGVHSQICETERNIPLLSANLS